MRRASEIRAAGSWNAQDEVDRVVLDAGDRHRRRVVLTGAAGLTFLIDLPRATMLADGDGLVLDDGSIVRVAGLAEPLVELSMPTPLEFARLAWHLGNRHTDVQIADRKLRIRRDHVLEDMATRLGAGVTPISAAFDPEPSTPHDANAHGHPHHHGSDHDA